MRHAAANLAAIIMLLVASVGCGGGKSSPTAPTTPAVQTTRTISVSGNLNFGDVLVGESWTATMTITNTGTAPLTISALQGPSGFTASWLSGVIPAGGSQAVSVGFAPTAPGDYSGTVTAVGDQTSGTNTLSVQARAFSNLKGGWTGTYSAVAFGGSGSCSMTWIVNAQTGSQFSGTWQKSGVSSCSQAGVFSGVIATSNSVSNLTFGATVAPSPCTNLSGSQVFTGVLSGTALNVQNTSTFRCPGQADFVASVTLSMRKQ